MNGSVAGGECNEPVKQDDIDSPSSLTFTQEFFGINDYTFTLANASGGGISITAIDNSGTHDCSFALFRPNATVGPPAIALPEQLLPAIALPYLGAWTFDSTCAADNASCCCFVGSANIREAPYGASW